MSMGLEMTFRHIAEDENTSCRLSYTELQQRLQEARGATKHVEKCIRNAMKTAVHLREDDIRRMNEARSGLLGSTA